MSLLNLISRCPIYGSGYTHLNISSSMAIDANISPLGYAISGNDNENAQAKRKKKFTAMAVK